MPAKLTPEERIGRGRAALDKLRKSIQDVDATTGQKRGQAYRRANSQGLAVNNALAAMANPRTNRHGATEAEKREAQAILDEAIRLYHDAWRRHHPG